LSFVDISSEMLCIAVFNKTMAKQFSVTYMTVLEYVNFTYVMCVTIHLLSTGVTRPKSLQRK